MYRLFQSYQIKDLWLRNRIVMSPMCMYAADTGGFIQDWHLIHYPTRAIGGVGLIMIEATAVEPRGRISDHDVGIWSDDHVSGLKKLVERIHSYGARVGIQLAHAGRKGILQHDQVVAPSAIPYSDTSVVPQALTLEGITQVIEAFQRGAQRALLADMDVIELHAAHGYLLNQFLSPLSNHRDDPYGGTFEGRVRLLREVIRAVRKVWPQEKPLFLRLSCEEYVEEGLHIADHLQIARIAKEEGVDLIDCSSGGIVPVKIEKLGPGYQVPYAERIKHTVHIPTAAVGLITTFEQAEEILLNERADLIFLGRELLRNPYWPINTANALGAPLDYWPTPYERARKKV